MSTRRFLCVVLCCALPWLPGICPAESLLTFAGLAFGTPIDACQAPLEAVTEGALRPDGEGNLWSKNPWTSGPVRFPVSVFAGGRLETGGLEELRLDAAGYLTDQPTRPDDATLEKVLAEFLRLAGAYQAQLREPPTLFLGLQPAPDQPPEAWGSQVYEEALTAEHLSGLYRQSQGQLCCKILYGNVLLSLTLGLAGPFETFALSLAYLDADRAALWRGSRYFR